MLSGDALHGGEMGSRRKRPGQPAVSSPAAMGAVRCGYAADGGEGEGLGGRRELSCGDVAGAAGSERASGSGGGEMAGTELGREGRERVSRGELAGGEM